MKAVAPRPFPVQPCTSQDGPRMFLAYPVLSGFFSLEHFQGVSL